MSRLLKKTLRAAAMMAAVAGAMVATPALAATLDLGKPADAHQAMLRLIGDLDGKPVFKDWDVTLFAVLPGAKPRPILRMQGFNAGRLIAKPDGSEMIVTERRGAAADAEAIGRDAGDELKRRGGPGFLST